MQDFLSDRRNNASAVATEGQRDGSEKASGYAAIAVMQPGQPGDFFVSLPSPQRRLSDL